MKKCISLFALFCFLAVAGQAMAYSISLAPSTQTIDVGNAASINIDLSIAPQEELFGFDFDLAFDPSVLSFNNLSVHSALSGYLTGYTAPSAGSPGLVTFDGALDLFSIAGLTQGTYTLASLSFDGIGQGSSTVDLTGDVLDLNPASGLVPVSATASVTTASVPEPGSMLFLGMGLAGFAALRRARS